MGKSGRLGFNPSDEDAWVLQRRLDALARETGAIVGGQPLARVVEERARRICETLVVDACVVRRVVGRELHLLASHGIPPDLLPPSLSATYGIGRQILKDRRPLAIEDTDESDVTRGHVGRSGGFEFRSYLGLPLIAEGEVIGILGVYLREQVRRFTEEDVAHLQVLANHLAVVIRNDELYREVQSLTLDLERRVEIRTAELAAANAELEAFTYTVAHDLRGPIRALLQFSHILEEELGNGASEMVADVLTRQRGAAQKLSSLVEDLLAFAHLGRASLLSEPVDLSHLALDVVSELSQVPRAHPVRIEVAPGLQAYGDRRYLKQVLANLFDNAAKFVRPGEPAWARLEGGPSEGSFVVRDAGIGFDPAYTSKLFQPFVRLVRDADYPGTGIGLAIVRRIVERHGGRISIMGRPGEGTEVWFTLPLPQTSGGVDKPAGMG